MVRCKQGQRGGRAPRLARIGQGGRPFGQAWMSKARWELAGTCVLEPSVSPSLSAGRLGAFAWAAVEMEAMVVETDEIALMGLLLPAGSYVAASCHPDARAARERAYFDANR